MPSNISELLQLARRARRHASAFAHDDAGPRLLEFARELEARAEGLAEVKSGEKQSSGG